MIYKLNSLNTQGPSHLLPLRGDHILSVECYPLSNKLSFDSNSGVCVEIFLYSLPKDPLLLSVQGLVSPTTQGNLPCPASDTLNRRLDTDREKENWQVAVKKLHRMQHLGTKSGDGESQSFFAHL